MAHGDRPVTVRTPARITARLDELFKAGEAAGALGSKACGAGGGCLLFLCAEGRREAIEGTLRAAGGGTIGCTFAPGTTIARG